MDGGEEVGLVLARTTELRSKVNRILDTAAHRRLSTDGVIKVPSLAADEVGEAVGAEGVTEEEEDGDEEEEEEGSLLYVRDALESLEQQLSALQTLEQQQRYERESTRARIDGCRRFLISKIKDYKGEVSEVIQEILDFAGGNFNHNNHLLLPPYSSDIPDVFILDDIYSSLPFIDKSRICQNGLAAKSMHDTERNMDESRMEPSKPMSGNILKGVKFALGLVLKSAITFASVVSILRVAGFQPTLMRRDSEFRWFDLFGRLGDAGEHASNQRTPVKILVMEDQDPRFVAKERVEIPFEPVGPAPNVSYGLG